MEVTVTAQQCVELSQSGVANVRFSDMEAVFAVAQMLHAVRPIAEAYELARREMLEEHGVIDPETNNLATNPDKTIKFKDVATRRMFERKHLEMLQAKAQVNVPALSMDKLKADGLTPGMLMPLLPFLQQ